MIKGTPIEDAVNVGPVLAGELGAAGVTTLEELHELGYLEAWKRLREKSPTRCVNSCLALAGAVKGVRWMKLPGAERARVSAEAKAIMDD